jgi:uncharacterized protein
MILDMNVFVGRWPFAPLKYEKAQDIVGLMDRAGIEKALVTSLNSVFYYDCQIGNREVGEACKQYPDRLIPCAVINPNLPRWREHLAACVDDYGVRGIKLHPDFHKFNLLPDMSSEEPAGVMAEAARRGLPVHIQTSLLDMRHYPGYCLVPEVPILKVVEAIEHYADNTFIVGGGRWFRARAFELAKQARAANLTNVYIATDGLGGPWDGIGALVEQMGSDRILFSSRTPILYSEASKRMIETSSIAQEDKAKILGGNAARILGL